MSKTTRIFAINALAYQSSADSITTHIKTLQGIEEVSVSIQEKTMTVTYEDTKTTIRKIIEAVQETGYTATLLSQNDFQPRVAHIEDTTKQPIQSWIASTIVLLLAFLPIPSFIPLILTVIPLYHLYKMILPIDTTRSETNIFFVLESMLYLLGCYAIATGQSITMIAGTLAFLPHIYLYQKQYTKIEIKEEKQTQNRYANVYHDHHENTQHINTIHPNDIIILRKNEIVPADGIVVSGYAFCDESVLTGNTELVEKSTNHYLYANTQIVNGSVEMKVDKILDTTALERFHQYSQQTALSSPNASPLTFLKKELYAFIIVVCLICWLGYYLQTHQFIPSTMIALSILAISCPVTFNLITEKYVIQSVQQAMSQHILFKTMEGMRDITSKDVLIIDQDGAITDRDISIEKMVSAPGTSQTKLEYIAYALASHSKMYYAKAMTSYLRKQRFTQDTVHDFQSLSRAGRENFKKLSNYNLISFKQAIEQNILPQEKIEELREEAELGKRIFVFTENNYYIGYAIAQKKILPDVKENIEKLQKEGYRVVLLTNGTQKETEYFKQKLHPDECYFIQSEEEKQKILDDYQKKGISFCYVSKDAWPLTQKENDLYIQIDAGAQIDSKTADVILTTNRLSDVLSVIQLSKDTFTAIENRQLLLIAYHILMTFLCGWIIPSVFSTSIPTILCYIISTYIIYHISRK